MPTNDNAQLDAAVTPKQLRRIAGERYFERGEDYFAGNAVRSLRWRNDGVEATVRGTHKYRVRLWMTDGELDHACDCPLGRESAFCKHCVATGLAWHAKPRPGANGTKSPRAVSFSETDVRKYLMGLDKEKLVTLILEQADEDEQLDRRLRIRAAGDAGETARLSVWKEAFDDAVAFDEFVPYEDAYDYARGIEELIDSVEEILRAGRDAEVVELAEYGLAALEGSLEHTDDSDGWLYGELKRFEAMHLEACLLAKPDPVALAERLFEQEMESSFDTFYQAAFTYADVLGESGLAEYYHLAEVEWAKVPALGPGEDNPDRYGRRYRIAQIMAARAEESGDLEVAVAVRSRDLSSPYNFLGIAELCRIAGDSKQALEWAERGWHAFPNTRRDERLREFLAEAYQGADRKDEALKLIWEGFADRPSLDPYRRLGKHARRAGEWPGWRDKALALIRERIAGEAARTSGERAWMRPPFADHSLLVEIFLLERDPDAAWREAETGGCSRGVWLALAKRREKTHPEDAAKIYRKEVALLLRDTGNGVYREAVGFLAKVEALLAGAGRQTEFQSLLDEIRTTQKRKRNLMKMLDAKGW